VDSLLDNFKKGFAKPHTVELWILSA